MSVQTNLHHSHRAADVGRGVLGLAGVVALVVGVPVLLVAWVGSPLPAGVPAVSEVTGALRDTYIPDEFLVKALGLVCWLVWVELVASLLVEAVAYARGRKAGAVPLAGGLQRGAARLVATVALLGAVVATRGVPEPGARGVRPLVPVAEPVVSLVIERDEPALVVGDAGAEATVLQVGAPTYEVGRWDTLWEIAERHLGDPLRWREIYQLNEGCPQPGGGFLTDPDAIRAGWVLQLPADAVGLAPAAAAPAPAEPDGARVPGDPQVPEGAPMSPAGSDGSSVVVDGGLVLIDDGADDTLGGAVLVSESTPTDAQGGERAAEATIGSPLQPRIAQAPTEMTVVPGDNLWAIAEGQLADAWGRPPTDAEVAGHWQSLIDQNRDRLAPPGDPDLIFPGQVFVTPPAPPDPGVIQALSPADPIAPAIGAPAPAAEAPSADAADCDPEPAPAPGAQPEPAPDAGVAVPPGTTEPVPPVADDADPEADGATPPDGAAGTGTTESGSDDEEAAGGLPAPPPAGPADPGPGDATDPQPSGPGRDTDAGSASSGAGDADPVEQSNPVPVGLIGGGIALAGALVLLERRRRAQLRRRGRGRALPVPPAFVRAGEAHLRWGADIDGARLLDVALRAAASGAGATGLPPLRWAEVGGDVAVLVLASPSPAPPGFVALEGDRWLTSATVDELALAASHAAAPLPALVPVGTTEHGTELLVELESSGVVTVAGAADDVLGFLRALVVAASTAIWSDQPRIVPVGLEGELGRLPGVDAVASLGDALDLAEAHAARTEAALRALRCPTVAQARAVGATPEAWDPLVVVAAVPPRGSDEHRRLHALAGRPNSAVSLVTVAAIDTHIAGRAFTIGDHGWLTVDGVDEPVQPRRLDAPDARTLVDLLDGATRHADVALDDAIVELALRRPEPPPLPPPPPPPPPVLSPPGAGTGDRPPAEARRPVARTDARARFDELMREVEVLVKVLGEVGAVRLNGTSEEALVPTRQRALEAIAYLSLRESAVDREDLEVSLFPDGANAAKTIYNTVSAARTLVGDELFPPPEGGRYELSPAVVTDYGIFCELVAQADETDDAEAAADMLAEALRLVRGEPFTGVGRGYAWVGPHRGIIVAQVVDAAEELAEVRLAAGDWRSAEWAARQGLRAFPSDERMYRLLMRTARAAGNIPGVQRVFRELCDVLADPDLGVEPEDTLHPETIELLEELTGSVARRRGMGA